MGFQPTLPAATVYATTAGGNPRAPSNGEALVYHVEVETYLNRLSREYVALTGSSTIDPAVARSGDVHCFTAASGAVTTTLPSAAGAGAGYEVVFKRLDASANGWLIQRAGADVIDGVWTSFVMPTAGDAVVLRSDGMTKWLVILSAIAPVDEIVTVSETSRALLAGTRDLQVVQLLAAGGGAGNVDGQATANATGAAAGGGGGAEASFILDCRTLAQVRLEVGAAGAGAAAGTAANGTAGGASYISWSGGTNKIEAGGGQGSTGITASTTVRANDPPSAAVVTTAGSMALVRQLITCAGELGGPGLQFGAGGGRGGNGGGGEGGAGSSTPANGANAAGYGCGGAGPVSTTNNATNYGGGNGSAGRIILRHWILRSA